MFVLIAKPVPIPVPDYEWRYAPVTAYTSSVEETDDTPDITASGSKTAKGTIACPDRLEFGRRVIVAGKEYVCLDRMNKRYRDMEMYDIWFETKGEAYEFGTRKLIIKVYDHKKI
jgi:3D (Asp-Asp-Asp) domain-containing protein